MPSLAHSTTNDNRMTDLMKDVRELGREKAAGQDSLPKLALKVIDAAHNGVIEPHDPKVHGKDNPDPATTIYEAYVEAESKKAIHEHSKNGVKANVSKLRQLIAFGVNPNCDPIAVSTRSLEVRKELDEQQVKVKSVYPALVDVARRQNECDTSLTDEQIKEAVKKPEAPEKDVLNELKRAHKIVEALITGENGLMDQHDDTIAAEESLRKRIATMVLADEMADLQAKVAEMGGEIKFAGDPVEVAA